MKFKSENEKNEREATISDVVVKSLAALAEQDLPVYEALLSKIQEGFLEKPQSKSAINSFTDSLLEIILRQGGEDES